MQFARIENGIVVSRWTCDQNPIGDPSLMDVTGIENAVLGASYDPVSGVFTSPDPPID